ncbi:MAG TPA: DsbA family oxidoreductase [Acidocella sp.]|jgi:predicted DsbA family dithiol-disulfide isomerase|uniref:DsbA family oxidoreductase n=1 Tax=Acidocella sp. TaxID=50710 RepID=UPI002B6B9B19|nr:DsbA family oxidoreductase [Acidocella sp.]HVE21139.1 DsbA family oxidoreductase [Acidocella sp.]
MNILAPLPARLVIEVVHDFVCPWCYLGVKRLSLLLARRRDLNVEMVWRPFLLNPDMPRSGMTRSDYMIRKFGAEERGRRLYHSITELGASEGIEFNFAAIRRTPSSVDAHRLIRYAQAFGAADVLVDEIFRAHFVEGLDIGVPATLVRLAALQGMDARATALFLASSEGAEFVHAENLHAHRLGINGVPCFLIDGEHAIAGAQEVEVLERLIDLAACTMRER